MTAVLFLLVAVVPAGWLAQVLAEAYHDARPRRQVAACSHRAAGRPGERHRAVSPWPVAKPSWDDSATIDIEVTGWFTDTADVKRELAGSIAETLRSKGLLMWPGFGVGTSERESRFGAAAVVCLWVVGLAAEAGL